MVGIPGFPCIWKAQSPESAFFKWEFLSSYKFMHSIKHALPEKDPRPQHSLMVYLSQFWDLDSHNSLWFNVSFSYC